MKRVLRIVSILTALGFVAPAFAQETKPAETAKTEKAPAKKEAKKAKKAKKEAAPKAAPEAAPAAK